jgi:thiol-disulfide isomerase/thioredoxin
VSPGVIALLAAIAFAIVGGASWRLTNGRMRAPRAARSSNVVEVSEGDKTHFAPESRPNLHSVGAAASAAHAMPPDGLGLSADGLGLSADGLSADGLGLSADGLGLSCDAPAPSGAAPAPSRGRLTSEQLGHALGERATLLQFSTAFCAPCRATRQILADVASMTQGVTHVEIDAESRLDLVRQLNVLRTPTVLVLAADGSVVRRASGQPRKPDVIAAIGVAVELS